MSIGGFWHVYLANPGQPKPYAARVLRGSKLVGLGLNALKGVHLDGKQRTRPSMREQIIWLAGKRHVCSGARSSLRRARLGRRRAHAAEAALCVVRGVDQRPRLGLGDPHGDCASVVADVRDLAVALVGRRQAS